MRREVGERVERALGDARPHAGDRQESLDHQVAPLLEDVPHLHHRVARAEQRRLGRGLRDGGGVAGALALHRVDRLRERGRRDAPADAPAGHRERLADAVDDDEAIAQLGRDLRERRVLEARVDQVAVDLVDDHPDVVLREDARERAQLIRGVRAAGRVGRRAEDERLGPRRDRSFERLRREQEALLLRGRHVHGRGAHHAHLLRVAHPVGRRDDDLVAGLVERHRDVEERVLGAHRRDDHVGRRRPAAVRRRGRADRLLQRRGAGDRRVARGALLGGLVRGVGDVLGRREVGLADAERVDLVARLAELDGPRVHGERCAGRDDVEASRERERHLACPFTDRCRGEGENARPVSHQPSAVSQREPAPKAESPRPHPFADGSDPFTEWSRPIRRRSPDHSPTVPDHLPNGPDPFADGPRPFAEWSRPIRRRSSREPLRGYAATSPHAEPVAGRGSA